MKGANCMKRSLTLNGLGLKCLGWVFTFCAVGGLLIPDSAAGGVLAYLGYISLPVFAFLLVEGFQNTENYNRYVLTLLIAAVVTEPFYDYACNGVWLELAGANGQNILFALALGLVQLHFLQAMGTANVGRILASGLMVLCSALWCFLLNIPGGALVEVSVGLLYLLEDHPRAKYGSVGALGLLFGVTPVLALPLVACYNGQRGNYCKYIFYAAYPALWALVAIVKLLAA